MSTIAVDAMGGDSAPEEVVKGAILAKKEGVDVILSGDENLIKSYLAKTRCTIHVLVVKLSKIILVTCKAVVSHLFLYMFNREFFA